MNKQLAFRTEDAILFTLRDLANHLERMEERLVRERGITPLEWNVLLQIAGDPNFPDTPAKGADLLASDIAESRGLSRPHISAAVNGLTAKGLITQNPAQADRRRRLLKLTDAGKDMIKQIAPNRRKRTGLVFKGLAQSDLDTLLENMRNLREQARSIAIGGK